ncbi:MAG: sigma-70 family RNA polymerase sigma factor [Anaerolineaceae bacterium]|nr:sigma-70 family RNA polymerase sigma factor [Anaerolineaceae bacterium]
MATSHLQSMRRWQPELDLDAEPIAESKNNPAAFSVLYDRYVQPVYRYLFYRVGSVPEAEDLTSQTFLAALEALPRYQHRGNFAAWLFCIARTRVIDYIRTQHRQLPLADTQLAETADPLAQIAHSDEIAQLSSLLHLLDDDERELIGLRYTAGLPFAEIAVILGSNQNTVKKTLYRILARLQSQMEDLHHG